MNLDLRQAIVQRVQDKSNDELLDVVQSSVGNDERTLPGLGVLFEIIWNNSGDDLHEQLISSLKTGLTH